MKPATGPKANTKILYLFMILSTVFLVGTFLWHSNEARKASETAQIAAKEHAELIKQIQELQSTQLSSFIHDNHAWNDLSAKVQEASSTPSVGDQAIKWFDQNVDSARALYRLDGVWVFSTEGKLIYSAGNRECRNTLSKLSPYDVKRIFKDDPEQRIYDKYQTADGNRFFLKSTSGPLVHFVGTKITGENSTNVTGYMIAAQSWDQSFINQLGKRTDSDVQIDYKTNVSKDTESGTTAVLRDNLGEPLGVIRYASNSRLQAHLSGLRDRTLYVLIIVSMLLISCTYVAIFKWIGEPLKKISGALTGGDLTELGDIDKYGQEFDQIGSMITLFFMQRDALTKSKEQLEIRVAERTKELRDAYDSTIEGWSRALEFRDQETEGHCRRVTTMTVRLASELGFNGEDLTNLRRGALLHDIGKMGIPDSILLKPGKLTPEERRVMEQHTIYAYQMLYPINFLRNCLEIPLYHHEKFDGTGYPYGLKGEQIPLPARLFAVIDVWDALRSDRPYRQAWPEDRVTQYLIENSGTHFDPDIVRAFLKISEEEKYNLRQESIQKAA